ncbi:MAG: hypothetical protein QME64_01425 [bacterium]|nr:hypothetical protein [bacterium]
MAAEKGKPIKCIMTDCQFYSEQIINTTQGQNKQIFCSSPNWALISITRIDLGCPSYRLDWTKHAGKMPTPETPEPEEPTASILPRKVAPKPDSPKNKKVKPEKTAPAPNQKPTAPKKPVPDFAPPVNLKPKSDPEPEPSKPFSRMKTLPPPEEIVRQFIESWNAQDFATEYHCLSHTLTLPPLGDYILSRKSIYQALAEQIGKGTAPQQHADIKKVEFRTGGVYIECLRKDSLGKETKEYLQEFLLRREEGGWKITQVHSKRLRTT